MLTHGEQLIWAALYAAALQEGVHQTQRTIRKPNPAGGFRDVVVYVNTEERAARAAFQATSQLETLRTVEALLLAGEDTDDKAKTIKALKAMQVGQ